MKDSLIRVKRNKIKSFDRFGSSFDPWAPFMRLCWSNDDDEVCEEFKKK